MQLLKRGLLITFVIVLAPILHPIFGRSIILFSVPLIVCLLLLTKLKERPTIYVGAALSIAVAFLWGVSYVSSSTLGTGFGIALVTLITCMVGVITAILINRFIK